MRLFDESMWERSWFNDLSWKSKYLYMYAWSQCDIAGFLELNYNKISFHMGCDVADHDFDELEYIFEWYDNDTIFIKDFISRTLGRLDGNSRVVKKVIRVLKERDFIDWYLRIQEELKPVVLTNRRVGQKLKNIILDRDDMCQECMSVRSHAVARLDDGPPTEKNTIGVCDRCKRDILRDQGKGPSKYRDIISRKVRFEVLSRDHFKCHYCGVSSKQAILEVDHIKPVSKNGKNDMENLVAACKSCNIGKSNKLMADL